MMNKISFIFLLITISLSSIAQVTFVIESFPENTPDDDFIYIVGSMNNWNPGDENYKLQKNSEDKWQITLEAQDQGSNIEFKFTRGDWSTVEKGANGEEIPNRQFTYGNGETQQIDILNWADQGSGGGESTAADNVHIMDEAFYIPQLDRNRRIWIYLPPNYENSSEDYPVLYMHDGQNLFDQYTSYSGEWEVDETLNNLAGEGYQVPIVIGIDNGGAERINELTPWVNTQYGGGDGDAYISFIVETLKPYVDEHYRTQNERESTGIMGSSLGGLISHYGGLKHQDVFAKLGIFSPSYWFSDSVWAFTNEMGKQESMRIYQMAGGQESSSMVPNMQAMQDTLTALGFSSAELYTTVIPNGQHNEASWKSQFGAAYLWLFSDFASGVHSQLSNLEIEISPNPAQNELFIRNMKNKDLDSIIIIDMQGKIVFEQHSDIGNKIDISSLNSGGYVLIIYSDNNKYKETFIKE